MIGPRLEQANRIARKRMARLGYPVMWQRFRKWNGSCSCGMCSGPKYKRKGLTRRLRRVEG